MLKTLRYHFGVILRFGLLGGIVALYLAAIGMIETFLQRDLVGTFISMGNIFLFLGAIGAGLFVARDLKKRAVDVKVAAAGSIVAGLISSISLIILTFIIQIFVIQTPKTGSVFFLRDMFVNLSPTLLNTITMGSGLFVGNFLFFLTSGLMGLIGASFILLPAKWRRAWTYSLIWTFGIGLFSELVSQVIQQIFGPGLNNFLFVSKSLTPPAALIIFVLAFAAGYFEINRTTRTRWSQMPANRQKSGRVILIVLGAALVASLPWLIGLYLSQTLFLVGLYIIMGLGLNIVVGLAGLLDLGYVAFFAFGAYTMGVLTTTGSLGRGGFTFWTAIPFAVIVGVLWGLLLGFPVLRMRGDYLAIVTLGFGEIIRILAISNWLAPIEGGAQGILQIPSPHIFGLALNSPQLMYYLDLAGALLVAFVTIRLRSSRLGRQWMAMREDEDVAEAMGINLVTTKLSAFAIGASFSALAGAIFAARLGNIFPASFNILVSINALALIIVGGLGSIPGVIVGAIVLVGLPEILREFENYRLLLYGILLVVMMVVKPEGFWPEARRSQELHAQNEQIPNQVAEGD